MIKVLLLKRRFVKWLLLLAVLALTAYIWQLNTLVQQSFHQSGASDDLSYEQQPKMVINMLLLVEDQSYFEHHGVDVKEILRVLRDHLWADKPLRGASTITQQLVKNTLLSREKTLGRKTKEALMAYLLELNFDKTFILNRYLNTVYLGQQGNREVRGFHRAAKFYFNKPIERLSLAEVATLVALVKGPSYYHPVKHPKRLAGRRDLVLQLYHRYQKIVK